MLDGLQFVVFAPGPIPPAINQAIRACHGAIYAKLYHEAVARGRLFCCECGTEGVVASGASGCSLICDACADGALSFNRLCVQSVRQFGSTAIWGLN